MSGITRPPPPPSKVTVRASGHSGRLREAHRDIGARSRGPVRGLPALLCSQRRVFLHLGPSITFVRDRLCWDVVQVVISHSPEVTADGRDVVWLGKVVSPRSFDQGECPASRVD